MLWGEFRCKHNSADGEVLFETLVEPWTLNYVSGAESRSTGQFKTLTAVSLFMILMTGRLKELRENR